MIINFNKLLCGREEYLDSKLITESCYLIKI